MTFQKVCPPERLQVCLAAIADAGAVVLSVSPIGIAGVITGFLVVYSFVHEPMPLPYPLPETHPAPPQTKPQTTRVPWSPPCTGFSQDTCGPKEFIRPQPKQQPQPEPAPKPQLPDPVIPYASCTPTPRPDFIWRGIDDPVAKPRHFKPRFPDDAEGLSFFEGRTNIRAASGKPFRAGFTRSALIAAGFSVDLDNVPPGHNSIRRLNSQEWEEWLHANNPQHRYQQDLASMAAIVEPNTSP